MLRQAKTKPTTLSAEADRIAAVAEADLDDLDPTKNVARDRQFVTALARGLDILACFDAGRPLLGGTEIAGLLGLPQPTVWRLCRTMTKLGYLVSDSDDRLRPALPSLRLGYTALSDMTVGELARPHLQELADELGGAAGLAVRDGTDMRLIERCESDSQLLMSLRVGSRVPIATSALGWAYLAGLTGPERESVLAEVKPDREVWRRAAPAFASEMATFGTKGFVLNERVFHPGYVTVAVPVAGPGGQPAFALNCGGSVSAVDPTALVEDIAPRLRQLGLLLASIVAADDPASRSRA